MHDAFHLLATKRSGQPVASVNNVAGQKNENSYLLHITDNKTGDKYLVDGGALLSILPPTPHQRLKGPTTTKLKAANGTNIDCFGSVTNTIQIGTNCFEFEFVVADVQCRILGADFLAKYYLAPNHRDALLLNLQDYSTLPAEHARGFKSNPINFVSQLDDPFYNLLDKYPQICTPSFTLKQPQHGVEHHIPTSGTPVQSRARRLDPEKLAVAKAELDKLVELGIAYRGKSEWSSPLLVTTKPNGGWRVCGDYRRLNNMTTDDRYPVRSIADFTAELHGKKIFSKIDLMKGYHQIPVAQGDVPKTAVITPFGLYIFPRTPFGLKNAGQDFQRLMDSILGDLPRVYVYIDDILVASENAEQHLQDLEQVFKTLAANGMVVQRSKCVLGVESLEFLGYRVDSEGIQPLPDRVAAIRATTPPTSVKELQRFLGMVGYYRRFIPRAAAHMFHLFDALKGKPKNLEWTVDCQTSFDAIKEALASAALLFHPRPGAQLALTTDASNMAVGGVLEQRGPKGWEPLAFYSSKLKPNERLWPPYDRELLGAFKGIRHFRDMVEGRAFTLYTDHQSLIPSLSKKTDPQTARQTYQLSCISEYTTDIRYVQGKANLVADALSRPNEVLEDEIPSINTVHTHPEPSSAPTSTGSSIEAKGPNFNGAHSPNPREIPTNGTATTSGSTLGTSKSYASATCPTGSSSGLPNTSSLNSEHRAASAEKSEVAFADLNCVIASVGDMGIDWTEVARQQILDPEFRRLREDPRCTLKFESIDIGQNNLVVDKSNGPARPFVPFAFRRRIFDLIHGLGHPGVARTRKAICDKFVWPSMREDVSKWARECLECQRAKVTKHTIPPIGEFTVPNRRFEHINIDLVTLPTSNGFKYLFTAVDRFTRWPIAVPLVDITSESVLDAFTYGWVQQFGVPTTVTSDRGSQFSSHLFQQLAKTWGIKHIMTTPYHPEANGLVERFHRRLKEALIALGSDSPEQWFWRLPCVMLAIRTTIKPDIGASPADLVFGEGLAVPGETFPSNPATDETLHRQRQSALADNRLEVARLQPIQTSAHRQPQIHLPMDLDTCSHIFVRRGGVQSTLAAPYVGPYRVVRRNAQNFTFAVPGRANEVVAIARVKPAFCSTDDAEDNEPDEPRPPGRPPRPPQNPPSPPLRPRRNRRRPRRDQASPAPRQDEFAQSPPRSPPGSPVVRPQRSRRTRALSPTPSPSPQRDTTGQFDPTHGNDEFFGDLDPPPPLSPYRGGPPTDWHSPSPSPPPPPPPRDVPSPKARPPRIRLFSRPRPGDFSYRAAPAAPAAPGARPDAPLESPQGPLRPAKTRFFSKPGFASDSRRRRPDVNALSALLKEHLDIPPSPLSTDDSSPTGFFGNFATEKSNARSYLEPEWLRSLSDA